MSSSCHTTDSGNAEFFARLYKGKLIYNWMHHCWYYWTGIRWSRCDIGQQVQLAKEAMKKRRELAEKIENLDARRKEIGWTLTSESNSRIHAMLDLAQSEPNVANNGQQWDIDPYLIGIPSGYVDLETGKIKKASPLVRILNSTTTDPKPKPPKKWIEFLRESLGSQELLDYMQRALGYSITGDVSERAFFCLFGKGSNGKTVLLEVVKRLLGGYGYTMPFSTIERLQNERISNDVAALAGKRFVAASELKENTRLNEGRIKSLTGNEKLTARHLHKEYFEFKPQAKFWLAFNHKPISRDSSEGYWDRLKLITFSNRVTGARKDKYLQEKLEYEKGEILGWLIEGAMEWKRIGLGTCKSIEDDTNLYRKESDPLIEWLEECCEAGSFVTPVSTLRDSYVRWCEVNGERFPATRQAFNKYLTERDFTQDLIKYKGDTLRVWRGIRINGIIGLQNQVTETESNSKIQ